MDDANALDSESLAPTDDATRVSRVDLLREKLLPNGAFEDEMAAALQCSRRQIQRLGLPFTKNGETRIYDVPGSREAIRRRMKPP